MQIENCRFQNNQSEIGNRKSEIPSVAHRVDHNIDPQLVRR